VWSGPYILQTYDADKKEATAVKNPNWWMDTGPYLERIDFKFVPDAETVATMVQNNQIDVTIKSPIPLLLKAKYPDMFRTAKAVGFNIFCLRPAAEPTDDINVRKALILAVNMADVQKAAFPEGDCETVNQIIDPAIPCKETNPVWYKQDIAAAKAALAASKWGGPEKLPKLRVSPRGNNQSLIRALEVIMEQWRKNLGITNIEFKAVHTEFGPDLRKLNILRDDIVVRFPDAPTYLRTGIHSQGEFVFDSNPNDPASAPIMGGYKNAKVDELIDQALALSPSDPKRCELALQAQRLFMDDYMIFMFGKPFSYQMSRDYVKNCVYGPDRGLIEPWKIYIAKH
jgi:peptide/nickel transport system substrate-binding protein